MRPPRLGEALRRVADWLADVVEDEDEDEGTTEELSRLKQEARRLQGEVLSAAHVDAMALPVHQHAHAQQDFRRTWSACHVLCQQTLDWCDIEWECLQPRGGELDGWNTMAEDVARILDPGSSTNGDAVFEVVAGVAREVSMLRHQMLGAAHAESKESAAALSTLDALDQQLRDVTIIADDGETGNGWPYHANVEWEELSDEQRAAAIRLGRTMEQWGTHHQAR